MFRLKQIPLLGYAVIALFLLNGIILGYVINLSSRDSTSTTTVYQNGPQGIPGPIGQTGAQGINGIGQIGAQGATGEDGRSGTVLQMLQPIIIAGEEGPKGDTGEKGQDGASDGIQLRKNPSNGNIEQKRDSDDGWTSLLTKCEYQDNCDAN